MKDRGDEIEIAADTGGVAPEVYAEYLLRKAQRQEAVSSHLAATARNGAAMDPRGDVYTDPLPAHKQIVDL